MFNFKIKLARREYHVSEPVHLHWKKFLIWGIVGFAAGFALWFFLFSPTFAIKSVSVASTNLVDAKELQKFILKEAKGKNYFLISLNDLENKIWAKFPKVAQIEFKKNFPSGLYAKLVPLDLALLWQTGGLNYLLNSDGKVVGQIEAPPTPTATPTAIPTATVAPTQNETQISAPTETPEQEEIPAVTATSTFTSTITPTPLPIPIIDAKTAARLKISQVTDEANVPVEFGKRVVSPEFIKFIKRLNEILPARLKINPSSYSITETTFDLKANTDKWAIYFDTTRDADAQVDVLGRAMQHPAFVVYEYVDLRVEGKVYYK